MAITYSKIDQGRKITVGTGTPASNSLTGSNGDTYFDATSGIAYQYTSGWNAIGASNSSIGQLYWIGNSTATVTSVAGTYYLVNPVAGTLNPLSTSDFDSPSNGRLRYIGTTTKKFKATISLTIYNTRTADNDDYSFKLYKNGVAVDDSLQQIMTNGQTSASFNYQSINLETIVQLATNDYVELYVSNDSSNATAGRPIITCAQIRLWE